MHSVTNRIKDVKQPRGGYIKPSAFEMIQLNDGKALNDAENIHASTVGTVVDYLMRFVMGADVTEAFKISLMGVCAAVQSGMIEVIQEASVYLDDIHSLDDKSIINACKMVTFDVWYRNPESALWAKPARVLNPDNATIENIRIMVERSIKFFDTYGPVTVDGFMFEPYGYTDVVSSGDGDFLTVDTLWDFKVSKSNPTSKHTLQLLMYWIMGQHSGKPEYKTITKLGIFNPRLNSVYLFDVNNVSDEIIADIENNVICYH